MTTSLLQTVEDLESEAVTDIKAAWNAGVAEAVQFYTNDVKPIVSATLTYVEQNGAADLLLIGKRVVAAAWDDLTGSGNLLQDLTALAGTVWDEAKSAGLQIEQGAALLVTSMAHAEAAQATAAATPDADKTA